MNTPGCTKEACGFRDLRNEIRRQGVEIVGISADGAASHQRFARKYRLPFTLLSDPDKKVMSTYGAYEEKMMYGKKTTGVIRSTVWVCSDGKVKRHWRRETSPGKHPQQELQALRGGNGQ